jgi:predicted metalloprotease with PDZ domain
MPAAHQATAPSAVHYRVEATDLHAHLFRITLSLQAPAADQLLSLPAWIPGSYLIREFSKNLQNLSARQGRRNAAITQLSKDQWRVHCAADKPLVVTYEVCAYDTSVRTAWLDATRGFFNGTSLCLRVQGQTESPCTLEVIAPKKEATGSHWHCACGLKPFKLDARGFGMYQAADYDELVDSPVELGPFWSGSFTACGIAHRFVVAGAAPTFDHERLLRDTQAICETAIRFWHGKGKPPFERYVFLLNVVDDNYGGLEHRNSTALICGRRDLPRTGESKASDGYTTLLGLISHEYFHTWNVKRLRPAEFAPYDYTRENYTELLWFFEGFTSYYDDLLLRRANLIDDTTYLKLITKTCNQVLQTPGRHVQSVAQASFDAWVKYYRQDENTPNATVSYYTKGSLVALCLDLALRREGSHLDAVMRALWKRCAGGPMTEADLLAVLRALTGRTWDAEIQAWVHGTGELPVAELLAAHGVTLKAEPAQPAQRLGLRVQEGPSIQIKMVLRGGLAERAGFMAGDEWLGLEVQGQAWRLTRLDELALYAGQARRAVALVARDRRLLRLTLELQPAAARSKAAAPAPSNVGLSVSDTTAVQRWLAAS